MVNFIAALFLIIGGIKLAGPWTTLIQEHDILFDSPFQDEKSKGQGCETKEKLEEEQAAEEPAYVVPLPAYVPARYLFQSYWYPLSHQKEPISPPPDITL